MTITHNNRSLPIVPLLLLALVACSADRAPAPADDAANAPADAPAAPAPGTTVPGADAPVPVEPSPTPAEPAPTGDLARFDGYGDMRFGMTAAQARQAWGGELKGNAAEAGGTCYHLSPKWAKVPAELAFMIEDDKFVRYSSEDAKLVAPGGGRIGMTLDEINALYPGRVEQQPHKYSDGKYLRIKDAAGGDAVLIFETDDKGKVEEFRVGVPPQVDYVEGCA